MENAFIDRAFEALLPKQPLVDLLSRHDLYFETTLANTPALIEKAFALRYQIYCLERGFENPLEHLDGLEIDEFDRQAIHGLLFHRPSASAIGTVRIITPQLTVSHSLPIARLLWESGVDITNYVLMNQTVEVSRFAISKNFRRRKNDQLSDNPFGPNLKRELLREANLPCLSLIQFLVRQSSLRSISYWAAVMEPKLLRMLASLGIRFTSVGSLVMHHGLRQPCYCHVPTMLEEVRLERPEYWQILTNAGQFTVSEKRSTAFAAA